MAATAALLQALNQGISSGNLVDTKIILYSHRDSSSRICRPKALYATSHVLKSVPYFNDLLFGDFAESQPRDFNKEPIDEAGYAEDYGYLSDSDLEDDEDGKVASVPIPDGDKKAPHEAHEERVEKGKVVKIPDMAFVTFKAFLMYLYTNVIEFAPFGSKANRKSRSTEIAALSDDNVPRPSPKSIYRLADKYDVPALKALALNHIRGELAKCDIVHEAFSRFASRYDDVSSLYVNQLAYVWMEDSTTETTRTSFEKQIDSFVKGELEHATQILSALWEVVNKDGDITAPPNSSPAVAQVTSPAHWATVKLALIRSISKGVFFDRKYWARHSNAGDVLKPVYFSSIIMGDKVQQLNGLVIYPKNRKATIYLGGDANIDSDCEDDLTEAGDGAPGTKEEKEEQARAVLITGSFSTWKSLFFYRCTDTISFAPLKSCAPSLLAEEHLCYGKLRIQPLCDSAFADIKSKVSLDNVIGEVFSWVAASQRKVLDMECDLLVSNFKGPKTIAQMKENMEHISDGSSSHCGGALKLGFKKAFEVKKRERGVLLQCSYSSCGWHNSPVPYSSVGSNIYCPHCNNPNGGYDINGYYRYGPISYYMQCVGCKYQRTSSYTSCQSCGKRFL